MTYQVVVTAAAKEDLRNAYLWVAERAPPHRRAIARAVLTELRRAARDWANPDDLIVE